MDDSPEDRNLTFDLKDLAGHLIQHKMLRKLTDSLDDVKQTPEFQIIEHLQQESELVLDELIENFDIQSFIISILNNLKTNDFVEFDGVTVKLRSDHVSSILSKPKFDEPDEALRKESGSISTQQLDDIGAALSGTRTRRDRMLNELSQASTKSKAQKQDKELESLFDDVLGESLEDVLGDLIELESQDDSIQIITPLIDLIKPLGYVEDSVSENEYRKIPAYQVISTILKQYPISTEQIEKQIDTEASLSMLLSNLQSDNLINQTNDYRYTLSKVTLKKLKEYVDKKQEQLDKEDPDLELINFNIDREIFQFKEALLHLKYIKDTEKPLDSYQNKPEVDILSIVNTYPGKSSNEIKLLSDKTIPVVVMRMLSKLEADNVAYQDSDGNWFPSTKLRFLMAKNKLIESLAEEKFEELKLKFD